MSDIKTTMREVSRLKRLLAGYKSNPSQREKRKKTTARIKKLEREIAKMQTALKREKKKVASKKKPKRKRVGRPPKREYATYEEYEDFYDTPVGVILEKRQVITEQRISPKREYATYEEYEDFYDTPVGVILEKRQVITEQRILPKRKKKKAQPSKKPRITKRVGRKRKTIKKKIPIIKDYLDDIADEFDDFLDWDVELAGKTW